MRNRRRRKFGETINIDCATKCTDCTNKCIDCTNKCIDCATKCIDCTNKCIDCTNKCIDCTDKCIDCTDKCIDCTDKCIDCTDKCIDCTDKRIDCTDKCIDCTDKCIDCTDKSIDSCNNVSDVYFFKKRLNFGQYISSFDFVITGWNCIWLVGSDTCLIIRFQTLVGGFWENSTDEVTHHLSHNEVSSCVWLPDKTSEPDWSSKENVCRSNKRRRKKEKK